MNILPAAIRLYQKSPLVNRAVRLSVRAHHRLTPRGPRAACPYPGNCSAAGLAAANTMGMAALTGIVSRMAACNAGDCGWGEMKMMPHPMDGGGAC